MSLARLRLLQMSSPAFPIGGYSHSFGLESAIECGLVRDEAGVGRWIADVLEFSMGSYEIPLLRRMYQAWTTEDRCLLTRLNEEFLATREAFELRCASVQMGFSLKTLLAVLPDLPEFLMRTVDAVEEPALPLVWSGAANGWRISAHDTVTAYLWSWAENQVMVALKTVPIGQSSGQRVLLEVGRQIASYIDRHPVPSDGTRSNFAPALAILCCQHETQYSRLFRS